MFLGATSLFFFAMPWCPTGKLLSSFPWGDANMGWSGQLSFAAQWTWSILKPPKLFVDILGIYIYMGYDWYDLKISQAIQHICSIWWHFLGSKKIPWTSRWVFFHQKSIHPIASRRKSAAQRHDDMIHFPKALTWGAQRGWKKRGRCPWGDPQKYAKSLHSFQAVFTDV